MDDSQNCEICTFPLEIFYLIAQTDELSYRAMLAIPIFARTLTIGKILGFMKLFGHNMHIYKSFVGNIFIKWTRNSKLHRLNGPALIGANGDQEWWQNGRHHRLNGPAVIRQSGHQIWYINGRLHRTDGPSIIYANGDQRWYYNNLLHRENGPAIIATNGEQYWYHNGKQHRENGPAVIYEDGSLEYYLDDVLQPNPES